MSAVDPSLRTCNFALGYRSGEDDVVADFYEPALERALEYRRAVGFFSSTSLALLAGSVSAFVARGGTIQVVASPRLDEDDVADIARGYDTREVLKRSAVRVLEAEDDLSVLKGLGFLGRLIADGVLDIKLAFVQDAGRAGMYHEKIGYFRDAAGDVVAFTGSANETFHGLLANFESIQVFKSWLEPERTQRVIDDFDELWADRTQRLSVVDFPDVARELLERYALEHGAEPLLEAPRLLAWSEAGAGQAELSMPVGFLPRDYQVAALKAWLGQYGRGILKMATGTGKTKTAMCAATQLARVERTRGHALTVVVVAPYMHLVDQWADEVSAFGVAPVHIYESSDKWAPQAEQAVNATKLGSQATVVFIATTASFAGDRFQQLLKRIDGPLLLIGDEVHNLGARRFLSCLPNQATYRLGLSATPERWFDDEGTQALVRYFGEVVFELDLAKAIELGALTPYRYHPRLVELDDTEMVSYAILSKKIGALMGQAEADADDADSPLGALLRQRAGILGHAAGKLERFKADSLANAATWHQLVYCAEGYRRDADGVVVDDRSQVRQVTELLGRELGLSCQTYTAETPRAERRLLLNRFERGDDLRFLVSMRCLDEGVDIPDARVGYLLASSSNPRQFVQRRGRLLRRSPGKDHAVIYDYLAVPQPDVLGPDAFELERRLLTRELTRATEFAHLAQNYEECLPLLRPVKQRYGLMDL